MDKLGFKKDFLHWIKVIYKDPKAFLKINGHLSNAVSIHRGIRQGCPLSALIFIICTEFMALNIKEKNDISVFDRVITVSQYADDTCVSKRY